jgi:hypothetical protein
MRLTMRLTSLFAPDRATSRLGSAWASAWTSLGRGLRLVIRRLRDERERLGWTMHTDRARLYRTFGGYEWVVRMPRLLHDAESPDGDSGSTVDPCLLDVEIVRDDRGEPVSLSVFVEGSHWVEFPWPADAMSGDASAELQGDDLLVFAPRLRGDRLVVGGNGLAQPAGYTAPAALPSVDFVCQPGQGVWRVVSEPLGISPSSVEVTASRNRHGCTMAHVAIGEHVEHLFLGANYDPAAVEARTEPAGEGHEGQYRIVVECRRPAALRVSVLKAPVSPRVG